MAKSFFQNQQDIAKSQGFRKRFSKKSMDWFNDNIANIGKGDIPSPAKLLKDKALLKRNEPKIGKMFMYVYDPKTKKQMPYYDRLPLILMVDDAPGGFYGLNLHYLPPLLRAKFFDKLLKLKTNKAYDKYTKLKLSYDVLKGAAQFKEFGPCFKHYLIDQVKSNIVEVPAESWEMAVWLPTENFKKSSSSAVWQDSRRKI